MIIFLKMPTENSVKLFHIINSIYYLNYNRNCSYYKRIITHCHIMIRSSLNQRWVKISYSIAESNPSSGFVSGMTNVRH